MKKEKQENKKEEKPDMLRPQNHVKIYATNSFLGCSKQDFRINLCNEKIRNEKNTKWGYIIDATVILTPMGAKKTFNSLKKCLEEFEKEHGKIDIDQEEDKIKFD
ncbi:DUF3467 domain-containing protein [Candidatus Woesearchaeota archaeon]|nr:DUF3467 domain-containing protein [Candidatus Woesearchaeota archaeon]